MIRCQDVWVQYTRKFYREQSIKDFFLASFKKDKPAHHFWALKGITFELPPGQVMAVIGTNGSGKSTLLKTLGGLLPPDRGETLVEGVVAPLLELGTGFEPSLTGAENVYINGSILKMPRSEIASKFDTIVKFADLEEVIDSPLIHYSTGMTMRLGFSIAAHSQANILLIDEILAVGDQNFQEKCMERIKQMIAEGRTVLFVSHNMELVKSLCQTALWIDKGETLAYGPAEEVVERYLITTNEPYRKMRMEETRRKEEEARLKELEARRLEEEAIRQAEQERQKQEVLARKGSEVAIKKISFLNADREETGSFRMHEKFVVKLDFHAKVEVTGPIFGMAIHHKDGVHICGPNTQDCRFPIDSIQGEGAVFLTVPSLNLVPGTYQFSVAIWDATHTHAYDWEEKSAEFQVDLVGDYEPRGYVPLEFQWKMQDD